mmetsp:Transcript_5290/g.21637  ORF Transcript_5290/g.21637 Transcript_5290/m.21637 type:complete len:303 (-) Transcript_5290:215-1123(-)
MTRRERLPLNLAAVPREELAGVRLVLLSDDLQQRRRTELRGEQLLRRHVLLERRRQVGVHRARMQQDEAHLVLLPPKLDGAVLRQLVQRRLGRPVRVPPAEPVIAYGAHPGGQVRHNRRGARAPIRGGPRRRLHQQRRESLGDERGSHRVHPERPHHRGLVHARDARLRRHLPLDVQHRRGLHDDVHPPVDRSNRLRRRRDGSGVFDVEPHHGQPVRVGRLEGVERGGVVWVPARGDDVPARRGGSSGERRVLVLQELSHHGEADAPAGALHQGHVRGHRVVRAHGGGRERSGERRAIDSAP